MGFLGDKLSIFMVLFITFVGGLIHIYASAYMKKDEGYGKFFFYFNLFLASMLLLVLADSPLIMFIGWEGVGLCSYLLIGYWYQDPEKASAGMKAFVVNRIGDAAFLIGIFLCFSLFSSINFETIRAAIPQVMGQTHAITMLNLIALFLFIGATGSG
jgi:NADH-quinone oxidoreductase subunit L